MATGDDVKAIHESANIRIGDRPYIPIKYVFEMDDRRDPDQTTLGCVRVRQYPASRQSSWGAQWYGYTLDDLDLNLRVTKGQWIPTNEWREKYVSGEHTLTGDAEAQLQYPAVRDMQIDVVGSLYSMQGDEISAHAYFDPIKNAIVFTKQVYGIVRYKYYTTYRIYRYYPALYNDYEVYLIPNPNDYGQLLGFDRGPMRFIQPSAPVVFPIQPPEGISAEFELYRIESSAYAKEDGLWEQPLGFPGNTQYPDSDGETLDPTDKGIEIARVHEMAYFSLLNSTQRTEGVSSSRMASLPLDYAKELRGESNAGSKYITQSGTSTRDSSGRTLDTVRTEERQASKKEYYEKYRRMLNQQPTMRSVRYEVPVAKPYEDKQRAMDAMNVRRVLTTTTERDAAGNVTTRNRVTIESTEVFRIKLTVKGGRRPTIDTQVFRDQNNETQTDFDMQAARVNTMLAVLWEGIDWNTLRKAIRSSYDPTLYQVVFDASFPTHN